MTPQTQDLAAVVERVERLEREWRRAKRRARWLLVAGGFAAVGLVLAYALANTTPTAQAQGASSGLKEIRANRFILEDQNGKSRAELDVDKDGPGLALLDETGKQQPAIMGCYGIGVTRTLQAVIEQSHDDNGIVWPISVAPYTVCITPLNVAPDSAVMQRAERIYADLTARGVDVILDDRNDRPGVKFKDSELVGFPIRVGIGEKSLARGEVEIKPRGGALMPGVAPGASGSAPSGGRPVGGPSREGIPPGGVRCVAHRPGRRSTPPTASSPGGRPPVAPVPACLATQAAKVLIQSVRNCLLAAPILPLASYAVSRRERVDLPGEVSRTTRSNASWA